jgi:hypothetical protein
MVRKAFWPCSLGRELTCLGRAPSYSNSSIAYVARELEAIGHSCRMVAITCGVCLGLSLLSVPSSRELFSHHSSHHV